MRQPIIFNIHCKNGSNQEVVELQQRVNNDEIKHMIDGYELIFLVLTSDRNDIVCIYPTYIGDDELLNLQKENLRLLNTILKQKISNGETKDVSTIRKVFRKHKLERIIR